MYAYFWSGKLLSYKFMGFASSEFNQCSAGIVVTILKYPPSNLQAQG